MAAISPSPDPHLEKIRETLLMMSSLADRNLSLALKALVERDDDLCDAVEAEDSQLDKLEIQIDEQVVSHMALRAPKATDCRFVLVASKFSSNLERVGDESVSIARRARALNSEAELRPLVDLPKMGDIVLNMLRDASGCFIEGDYATAQQIVLRDKRVDELNRQNIRVLTDLMTDDSRTVTRGLNFLLISRSLERVADHAKNISEEVFYLYQGRDIRHKNTL